MLGKKCHLSYVSSDDPDQTPPLAASDLGLHFLSLSLINDATHKRVIA